MRGSSMPDVGDYNEKVVLQNVRHRRAGISQSEIADRSGLSRQAVSLIVRRLLENGLIVVSGTEPLARGKPRTLLKIAPRALLAAGVHIDPVEISVVVVDLAGQVLARRSAGAPTDDARADIVRIAVTLDDALGDVFRLDEVEPEGSGADATADGGAGAGTGGRTGTGAGNGIGTGTGIGTEAGIGTGTGRSPRFDRLLGIGVATPGGVDTLGGRVIDPPWLSGWNDVPVADLLSAETGVPVGLDKDTSAALTGEEWTAGRSTGTHLYIYVGSGIGSAVAVDGVVHRGFTDQAGEIGHMPTGLDGRRCGCGRFGCLGLYTDLTSLVDGMDGRGGEGSDGRGDRGIDGDAVPRADRADAPHVTRERVRQGVARARAGDEVARSTLELHGLALGEAIRTLIGVHDPDRVTIGGPAWNLLEEFSGPGMRERASGGPARGRTVEITSSRLGVDAGAIGAASLVLDRELSPHRRDWRRV